MTTYQSKDTNVYDKPSDRAYRQEFFSAFKLVNGFEFICLTLNYVCWEDRHWVTKYGSQPAAMLQKKKIFN